MAMTKALKLAVVGHTNVGKTSLLRTLTRDVGFGEVSHSPSTTRHVEGARLSVDGEALLELYDTPGLEDAIALLDYLERLDRPGERLDGPARLARFLDGSEARQRFGQGAQGARPPPAPGRRRHKPCWNKAPSANCIKPFDNASNAAWKTCCACTPSARTTPRPATCPCSTDAGATICSTQKPSSNSASISAEAWRRARPPGWASICWSAALPSARRR